MQKTMGISKVITPPNNKNIEVNYMIHIMKLKEQYFNYIKYGTKKYEIRLNDEKRKNIKRGDFIEFQKDRNIIFCGKKLFLKKIMNQK